MPVISAIQVERNNFLFSFDEQNFLRLFEIFDDSR